MLFCDAYPVKKMLPLDRIATATPCLDDFHACPLFKELMVRLTAAAGEPVPQARVPAMARKEGS